MTKTFNLNLNPNTDVSCIYGFSCMWVLFSDTNIILNITPELNQHLSDTVSTKAEHYKLHTALSKSRDQTASARSQNRSSTFQLRHQRHQQIYWLSGISKRALAMRGKDALVTKPCTHSNSIRLAWAQHFTSAAGLCCLENWKILLMLLASICYLAEADAVTCESLRGWKNSCFCCSW